MTTGPGPRRYVSTEEDSARWAGFAHRAGDVVISTRSKAGTTWVQTICALLIFQSPELPAPLAELSPWLDWTGTPREEVFARLASQSHRRFVKTHTPLDGLPLPCGRARRGRAWLAPEHVDRRGPAGGA